MKQHPNSADSDSSAYMHVIEPSAGRLSRYLDPLSDEGFMQIFGSEAHKEILIDFLNELFKGTKMIQDLQYQPIENPAAYPRPGELLLDALCTEKNENQFLVHLQRSSPGFCESSVFYHGCRLSGDQDPYESGEFDLLNAYSIGLLNFTWPESPSKACIHELAMRDRDTGELFSDAVNWKYIELPNFSKTETELHTGLDKWLYLLRNLGRMEEIPANLNTPVFQKVFQIVESGDFEKKE